MKKEVTLEILCYAVILLFVYAALSKLVIFNIYVGDLKRSPYINHYASLLSVTLPTVELGISALIYFDKTRRIGLWAATILMVLFTIYVGLMLGILDSRPCTCGGLIRDLTWKQHFVFNIVYTLIAGTGLWLHYKLYRHDHTNYRKASI